MIKLCSELKELLALKRMNHILDLVYIEEKKREEKEFEVLKEHKKELPELYQPRWAHGYESDLRPFIRKLMEFKSDEEAVKSIMKILDDEIKVGIDLLKSYTKERAE